MTLSSTKIKSYWQKLGWGQTIKLISWLVIILLLLSIYLSGKFLFLYFYNTITQVEKVFLLRSEISLKQIDMNIYENILSALKIKKTSNIEKIKQLSDPFGVETKPIITSNEESPMTPAP